VNSEKIPKNSDVPVLKIPNVAVLIEQYTKEPGLFIPGYKDIVTKAFKTKNRLDIMKVIEMSKDDNMDGVVSEDHSYILFGIENEIGTQKFNELMNQASPFAQQYWRSVTCFRKE
jgi:hypothetical protein